MKRLFATLMIVAACGGGSEYPSGTYAMSTRRPGCHKSGGRCPVAGPLHNAAGNNDNPAVIQALIDVGSQINAVAGPNWTPLSVAWLFSAPPEIADALIRNGATGSIEIDWEMCGPGAE